MNRKKLIIGLIFTSFLSLSSLKANLQSELVNLNNALTNLEMQLRVQPQPLPRDVAPCPVDQPQQQAQARDILLGFAKGAALAPKPREAARPQSAYQKRTPLSQSEERPAAKPGPKAQPLAQTTPPGGIPVAQPKAAPRLARTTSGYIPAKKKGDEVKPTLIALPIDIPSFKGSSIKLQGFARRANDLLTAQNPKNDAKQINDEINKKVTTPELKIENEPSRQLLYAIMRGILSIDPLLIQTSLETLRVAGIPQTALYKLMIFLYKKRIDFLTYEFGLMNKKDYKLTEGVRNDIEEALTYPIEISGEVQDAELKSCLQGDQLASKFFNDINDEWERLLKLLTQHEMQLNESFGIDIAVYTKQVKGEQREYCLAKTKGNKLPYKSLYDELEELVNASKDYEINKNSYSKLKKAFEVQNIINKLKAFQIYSTDTKFCQKCLNSDAYENIAEDKEYEKYFNQLRDFFATLPLAEQNLNILDQIKETEDVRRYFVAKYGQGARFIFKRIKDWDKIRQKDLNLIKETITTPKKLKDLIRENYKYLDRNKALKAVNYYR